MLGISSNIISCW